MKSSSLFVPTMVLALALPLLALAQTTKTITLKGDNADPGDVIEVDANAEVDISVNANGIVLTMPGIDLRTKCLGDITSNGYCFIAAAGLPADTADTDRDGVPNTNDQCPSTPFGQLTDRFGCALSELDDDGDGVPNGSDQCAGTPSGATVDAFGCSSGQQDGDGDGVLNASDACPNTPQGQSVNASGCAASQLDDDNDGVFNNVDQCPNTPTSEAANDVGCSPSQLTGAGAYCVGAPSDVDCEPGLNLDSIYSDAPEQLDIAVNTNRVRSMPFQTQANTTAWGLIGYTTNDSFTGYSYRIWISTTPGGTPISTKPACNINGGNINPASLYWSQNASVSNDPVVCPLSTSPQTYYVNHEVICNGATTSCTAGSRLPRITRFDVGRNAAPL